METMWLREALFTGMTSNTFKLGTALTLGWFWARIAGCSVLYRGGSMETVDFTNILTVADIDAEQISPPSYLGHDNNSTYFYVVRRANNIGKQEYTLSAAVKVSIGSDGDLVQPQPNDIFAVRAKQVAGNKVELVWFYCPLEQKSEPECFKVYCDEGTGQINYENPVATINYAGRIFYSYKTNTLVAGVYLFVIRAEGTGGIENESLARLRIQLDTCVPAAINILKAEAV